MKNLAKRSKKKINSYFADMRLDLDQHADNWIELLPNYWAVGSFFTVEEMRPCWGDELIPVNGNTRQDVILALREWIEEKEVECLATAKDIQDRYLKWRHLKTKGPPIGGSNIGKPRSFKSPDGTVYTVTNVAQLCKEHGLNGSNMYNVFTGRASNHRGWTKVKDQI